MEKLINKLKNKADFNSIVIYTKTNYLHIKRVHIFFETQDKYTLTIENYKTHKRQHFNDLTKVDLLSKLKKYKKIIKWEM